MAGLLADHKKPEDPIGENGLLKQLTKLVVEKALDAELAEHFDHGKNEPVANEGGNTRNGKSKKTLKREFGELSIEVSRDRNGTFEPQLIIANNKQLSYIQLREPKRSFFVESPMPKGQRRTLEQQLEDLKKKQAEIEAKIKTKLTLSADHKAIKAIIADIEKVADEAGVLAKDVLKIVSSKVSPRKPRTPNV